MAVTRKDVAKLANVSEATVSYVLNNKKRVTPEVKQRVLDAAKELNYHPNLLARSMITKKTRHIAMLVNNINNPHYSSILSGVQSVAEIEGYIVSLCSVDKEPKDTIDKLISRGIDGIIIALPFSSDFQLLLDDLKVPFASVNDNLQSDYRDAIFDMVRCFKEFGHTKLAFLSGLPMKESSHIRYWDFLAAMKENNLQVIPELFVDGTGETDEKSGYISADVLLNRHKQFTGVFCTNDLMAIGAMKRFWEAGLSIPSDISIVGCDGIITTLYTVPPLSTLNGHAFTLGKDLMYQLLSKMEPHLEFPVLKQTVRAEFIRRESLSRAKQFIGS